MNFELRHLGKAYCSLLIKHCCLGSNINPNRLGCLNLKSSDLLNKDKVLK